MSGLGWFLAIIAGAIAGWLAEKIMKSDMGLIMNIVLGIVGAIIGNAILGLVGLDFGDGSFIGQIIVAVIGACLLIFVWRMVTGSRRA